MSINLFCYECAHLQYLHSFPTRRSSDLPEQALADLQEVAEGARHPGFRGLSPLGPRSRGISRRETRARPRRNRRSEEHTSELQSHVNLVCRLLLEKKKN